MIARPTRPLISTPIDRRINRPELANDPLFVGWGVALGTRLW
jgi:hypothetical protein